MYTNCLRGSVVALTLLLSTIVYAPAQTNFTILKAMSTNNSVAPWGPVALGNDGYLYGATLGGGISNAGTIFRLRTNGTGFAILYNFASSNAATAYGGLTFGTNGALYGTTYSGGDSNFGTVYRINRDGTGFSVLHSFLGGTDGKNAMAGVISASDGFLYGTTVFSDSATRGTVFKIDGNGNNYSVLHRFTGNPDGQQPASRLMESTNGLLYGTTPFGGATAGAVFQLDKNGGNYAVLYRFTTGTGYSPQACVMESSDGFLYGTAYRDTGVVFKLSRDGLTYSMLYQFTATNGDGKFPNSELVEGSDGALYGCTEQGGTGGNGTVFKLNKEGGNYVVLHRFTGTGTGDGYSPRSGLVKGSNEIFYGTTYLGGGIGSGGLYALSSNVLPPRINSLVLSNSSNTLQCAGSSGVQYDVLRATNLLSPSWTNLATITAATNSLFTNVDLNPPSKGAFYRLQQH